MDPGKGLFCPKPLYDLFMNYLRMLYGLKYGIKAASGRPHSRTVTGQESADGSCNFGRAHRRFYSAVWTAAFREVSEMTCRRLYDAFAQGDLRCKTSFLWRLPSLFFWYRLLTSSFVTG